MLGGCWGGFVLLLVCLANLSSADLAKNEQDQGQQDASDDAFCSSIKDSHAHCWHRYHLSDLLGSIVQAGRENGLVGAAHQFWAIFGPGGKLHPAYFLEHKGHLFVEGLLLVIIGYLFVQQAFKPKPHSEEPLSEKVRQHAYMRQTATAHMHRHHRALVAPPGMQEINFLCKEWKPEPLAPPVEDDLLPTKIVTRCALEASSSAPGERSKKKKELLAFRRCTLACLHTVRHMVADCLQLRGQVCCL